MNTSGLSTESVDKATRVTGDINRISPLQGFSNPASKRNYAGRFNSLTQEQQRDVITRTSLKACKH